jgi:dTDP-L-rhamnose 4-epimerase
MTNLTRCGAPREVLKPIADFPDPPAAAAAESGCRRIPAVSIGLPNITRASTNLREPERYELCKSDLYPIDRSKLSDGGTLRGITRTTRRFPHQGRDSPEASRFSYLRRQGRSARAPEGKQRLMGKHVLITGGAGFIGSHLADELLRHGYRVRALDDLSPQVHGPGRKRPDYLDSQVELIVGDVRDADVLKRALKGIDAVYHLAATVGVGQSMYEIARYTSVNNLGTATLLEALMNQPVERLVVASSMSIYGEGLYRDPNRRPAAAAERSIDQLKAKDWEVRDARGQRLTPVPTPESKQPSLASIYALGKYDQERMCLITGRAYGIPTVALRFFNVFGTRQALSNPYTGVLAIFASRLLNGNPPLIYEDGLQQRDFVSVYDIAQACRLAMEVPEAAGRVFNVGSGRPYTVRQVAEQMGKVLGKEHIGFEVTGKYRVGDIRHCFADITLARRVLGYEPKVTLEDGLEELAGWLEGQVAEDHVAKARQELDARGLAL